MDAFRGFGAAAVRWVPQIGHGKAPSASWPPQLVQIAKCPRILPQFAFSGVHRWLSIVHPVGKPALRGVGFCGGDFLTVSEPTVVQLEDGPVTLVPLEELINRQRAVQAEVAKVREQAQQVGRQAGNKLAEAGQLLLDSSRAGQSASVDVGLLNEARSLSDQITMGENEVKSLANKGHRGIGGFVEQIGDGAKRSRLESALAIQREELRGQLMQIAQAAEGAQASQGDELLGQARDLQALSSKLTESANRQMSLLNEQAAEIKRRQEAARNMGFDSLYTAALLKSRGPTPVNSPLILKPNEHAYMSVQASLARRKIRVTYQGATRGLSFPIFHTGIRYRVGSFRGQPVSQDFLANVDTGTLVLSNQRLAFIGHNKSISMPLEKILNVESYTDGLAVFKEGRENADFFLFTRHQEFLLYLNYFLGQRDKSELNRKQGARP